MSDIAIPHCQAEHPRTSPVRGFLRSIPLVNSSYNLYRTVLRNLLDSAPLRVAEMQTRFRTVDPWDYTSNAEQERFADALNLIGPVREFRRALEIGCAEGHFTELVVNKCYDLLAVDLCDVALARAEARCKGLARVHFRQWDLQNDPVPGQFNLILLMGVLDYFSRPDLIRQIRNKLISSLEPYGYLLLSTTKAPKPCEVDWWGRYLLAGAKWKHGFFAQDARMKIVGEVDGPFYRHMLLQRVQC